MQVGGFHAGHGRRRRVGRMTMHSRNLPARAWRFMICRCIRISLVRFFVPAS